ncbi:transposase tc1-like protein [Ophiostoma piceae UAMH 11346]|uniref:Transposase tc1-like protein n=1 Tax=Ophiostoma piceae (strain UAMH 11346) TaxID=1262450 RepID=S3CJL5_OPHP1|nr:transposase tc1-like protein [Ophiostoma piceae UAMH 11346]
MVGVPGRSNGCNTCRRRRVKCDEAKPLCARCIKGGFQCQGYERHRTWHHTSSAPFADYNKPDQGTDVVVATIRRHKTSPPRELSFVAFQSDFCFAALFDNFVHWAYGGTWMEKAASSGIGLTGESIKALAQAHLGRVHHMSEIYIEGIARYGSCLRDMAAQIASTSKETSQLLVPMILFLIISNQESDRESTTAHAKGIARLLHVCGPEAFQEQPLLDAFESARSSLIIGSLIGRHRIFLEQDKWINIPWARHEGEKTPQTMLSDMLVKVPGLLEDYGHLLCLDQQTFATDAKVLLTKVEELLTDLFLWRWQWELISGRYVSSDTQVPFSSTTLVCLDFPQPSAAHECMLYNAVLMWVFGLLYKLEPCSAPMRIKACAAAARIKGGLLGLPNYSSTAVYQQVLALPGTVISIRDAAIEICLAYSWISRHHMLCREPARYYLFPMGMAVSVLGREHETYMWAREMLDASPVTKNYAAGSTGAANTAGFGFYVTEEAFHPGAGQPEDRLFSQEDMKLLS